VAPPPAQLLLHDRDLWVSERELLPVPSASWPAGERNE
jgi:hypothetical protein